MGQRYAPQPHLDRLTMKQLGSTLRPDYDPVVRSPLPQHQRDLLLQYAVAEALSETREAAPARSKEVVPHLPR